MAGSGKSVCVVGCGYVGYPLSLLAALSGFDVVAVDIDPEVVQRVNSGQALIPEPSIVDAADSVRRSGRLKAAISPSAADVFVIAVPTPIGPRRAPDMSAVIAATSSIAAVIEHGALVIVESTVSPGTCRSVVLPILEASGLEVGADIHLAHCPERVLPGQTIDELVNGERVIGGFDQPSALSARSFYSAFSKGDLLDTDLETAEFVKLMENTYRDVNIALANEIAGLARSLGVDPHDAVRIANGHPRVNYLSPGIGVGGHCIPVDPWFLVPQDADQARLVVEARRVNDAQPIKVADSILAQLETVEHPRIVLIGAAYKANVSDTRNAPAAMVAEHLESSGAHVSVFDSEVEGLRGDLVELCDGADALVVLVRHDSALDELNERYEDVIGAMRGAVVIDASGGAAITLDRSTLPG